MTGKKYGSGLIALVLLTMSATMGGCGYTPDAPDVSSGSTESVMPDKTPTESLNPPTSKSTKVKLYVSDNQCQELIPQEAWVSAEDPVTAAVNQIVSSINTSDLNLSAYRVNVANGVATIDFRLAPDSQRQLVSLSSCEQFALFGSLRKTLTSNTQWNIREVRFTEAAQDVVL